MIDLHTHTYCSDGLYSPPALIQAAYKKGLCAISITDHDNTLGIELVPAIEITTSRAESRLPAEEIEIHRYDQAARQHFIRLAHHFAQLIAGVSFFHAQANEFVWLGSEPVSQEMSEQLQKKAG